MLQRPKKLNVPSHKQLTQSKIALVGNTQSGKSSFILKYLTSQCPNYYQATLGVETHDKYLTGKNGSTIHVTFWDFSGKLDFLEVRNQFYRECSKILIFVDLGNKQSVDDMDLWVKQIKEGGATCPIVVVGSKVDIKKYGDVQKIAKGNGWQYFQISSKTGQGIHELVEQVA